MAVTWAITVNRTQVGLGSEIVKDVTMVATGTYVTGGDTTLTPASFGLDVVDLIIPVIDGFGANTNGVAIIAPNLGSSSGTASGGVITMKMFGGSGGSGQSFAEVGNGATLTGLTIHALVLGVD